MIEKFNSLDFAVTSTVSNSPTPFFRVYTDPFAVENLIATGSIYGSENFVFLSSLHSSPAATFQLKPSLGSITALTEIAFTNLSTFFLAANKIYCMTNGTTTESTGIPVLAGVNRIKTATHKDRSSNGTSTLNSLILAWNSDVRVANSANYVPVYISFNNGASFSNFEVVVTSNAAIAGGRIFDISVEHSFSKLAILVRDENGADVIYLTDAFNPGVLTMGYRNGASSDSLFFTGSKNSLPRISAIKGTLFVWGDGLNFSPDGGFNLFPISIVSRNAQVSPVGLGTSEFVKDVAFSNNGGFAILTSNNR